MALSETISHFLLVMAKTHNFECSLAMPFSVHLWLAIPACDKMLLPLHFGSWDVFSQENIDRPVDISYRKAKASKNGTLVQFSSINNFG